MRKAVLLFGTISIWLMLIFTVEGQTWDLRRADTYSKMLGDLRKKVQGTMCFKIPMIKPRASYVIVDLKNSDTQTFHIALKATDLYVVGYADTYINAKKESLQRAFVFKPERGEDNRGAFPNADEVNVLPYTGSYRDIEKSMNAGDRKKLDLTKAAIQGFFKDIYGKNIDNPGLKKKQAQFLLTTIQMIAEAARFKYIEEQVKRNYDKYNFKMDDKMYDIVNKWDTMSTTIANANDYVKDIALLNYVDKKCTNALSLQYITSEWPQALAHMLAQA